MDASTAGGNASRKESRHTLVSAASVLALLVFAVLALNLSLAPEGGVVASDKAISDYLLRHPEGVLTNAWLAVTLVGSGWPLVAILLACATLLIRARRPDLAVALALTAGSGGALNAGLKLLFHRARPGWDPVWYATLRDATGYSFPSGHSMGAMVVYGFMIYALLSAGPHTRGRTLGAVALGVLIVLIAASRVVLGAHWLTDVVGGLAAGLVWLAACITVVERARRHLGTSADP